MTSGFNLRQLLLRRIPILAWIPQYSSSKLLQDILAGLTVGLTAIPQGIAYAIVAGLPAQVCTFVWIKFFQLEFINKISEKEKLKWN